MPKNFKKAGGRMNGNKMLLGPADITLNDFANADLSGCVKAVRMKKPATNSIAKEVKQLCGPVDPAWYDREISEFDDVIKDDAVEDEEENECEDYYTKCRKIKKKNKNSNNDQRNKDDSGLEYPLDIWYMLSEYILPEDVGRFAGICRSALYVVNTTKFWHRLYERYYNAEIQLPERLQPCLMERHYCLRACAIRALYFLYSPFIERIHKAGLFESEPHFLVSSRCILMWHRKSKSWNFYFKFRQDGYGKEKTFSKRDKLGMLDDINFNNEKGCKVLHAACTDFVPVPSVIMGMILTKVYLNVSREMRYHRLKLVFHPSYKYKTDCSSEITVLLDPVVNVRILNWWHPHYPVFNIT